MTDSFAPRRRDLLTLAAGAAALPMLPHGALAQPAWPTQAVRKVVPFAAGGPTDVPARLLADTMSDTVTFIKGFLTESQARSAAFCWGLRRPRLLCFEGEGPTAFGHAVDGVEQLAHGGDEGDLGRLSVSAQAVVERLEPRISVYSTEDGHP